MDNRRKHTRLDKQYRLEYGPFTSVISQDTLKPGTLLNLSGGGVLFTADEPFSTGTHLFVKVYVTGWAQELGAIIKVDNPKSELLLKTIVEVIRSDFDNENNQYLIGAKFLGQVHT